MEAAKQNAVTPAMRKVVENVRNYIILRDKAFAELLIWVPTDIDLGSPYYGYATRSKTYVSRKFLEELTLPQQAAVIVHEVMHVVCQHVNAMRRGHYHPLLANIAQDALINEAIGQQSWLQLVEGCVRFREWVKGSNRPWEQWTWQQVYWWLLENLPRTNKPQPGAIPVDPSYFPPEMRGSKSGERLQGPTPFQPDLDLSSDEDGEGGAERHTDEVQERVWQQRLQRALQGDKPGGLLRSIAPLLPSAQTPWRQVLRKALQKALTRRRVEDWTRPGRRTLAKVVPYFEPAQVPPPSLPVVTVVFDTSGSIDDKTLKVFAAEVEQIRRQYQAEVYLLGCDAAVHGETRIRNDGRSLWQHLQTRPNLLKGGGGTDFRPALQRAAELGSRLCIYFTDLEGTFGELPRKSMRVVWAATTNIQPPFGEVVRIGG